VDKIAKAANVNKALIYYHFKNKSDLVFSVFMGSIRELNEHLQGMEGVPLDGRDKLDIKEKIRKEIEFLLNQKKAIAVLLSEAFKTGAKESYLYKLAEIVIDNELGKILSPSALDTREGRRKHRYARLFEFFTGFIPVVAFVALRDTWCEYFEYDEGEALELFLEAFEESHISAHIKNQKK
jgi:AcrR family transcriptional regulator